MTGSSAIGILGGGQLASMICEAARRLGFRTVVLTPQSDAVARDTCDDLIVADFNDADALTRLANMVDIVTLDTEHVPLSGLRTLEQHCVVAPGESVMAQINDRLTQRGMLSRLDLAQPQFLSIDKVAALRVAQNCAAFPAVLKTRHGGYDGQGQQRVASPEDLPGAWEVLKHQPCVLESWLTDVWEFSVIGARNAKGEISLYPPIENIHREGQLHVSKLPCELPAAVIDQAFAAWKKIANHLDICGVMTVEFFIDADEKIWINEIAPRVHNSGHLTKRAFACSQFELHVRALMGLELPELEPDRAAAMINLYPEVGTATESDALALQAQVGGDLFWYGKSARPRRKMGHWLMAPEQVDAAQRALQNTRQAQDTAGA